MNLNRPYFLLFNAITDALCMLENQNYGHSRETLRCAQQKAEELILAESDDAPDG